MNKHVYFRSHFFPAVGPTWIIKMLCGFIQLQTWSDTIFFLISTKIHSSFSSLSYRIERNVETNSTLGCFLMRFFPFEHAPNNLFMIMTSTLFGAKSLPKMWLLQWDQRLPQMCRAKAERFSGSFPHSWRWLSREILQPFYPFQWIFSFCLLFFRISENDWFCCFVPALVQFLAFVPFFLSSS